jgi:hypothetical protein
VQESDPIVGVIEIPSEVVLGVNFVLLMTSMLSFAQSVRMFIHAVRNCLELLYVHAMARAMYKHLCGGWLFLKHNAGVEVRPSVTRKKIMQPLSRKLY